MINYLYLEFENLSNNKYDYYFFEKTKNMYKKHIQ